MMNEQRLLEAVEEQKRKMITRMLWMQSAELQEKMH